MSTPTSELPATTWRGVNLAALVAAQARATPSAIAIVDESTTTYAGLWTRAAAIATALIARGLGAEQPVAVLMQRNADMVATLLGILWAGGAYVPLDPDDPLPRSVRMLEVAGCALVLASAGLLPGLRTALARRDGPASAAPTLLDVASIASAGGPEPACAAGGTRLAYILFTSGSSGEPKGVEIEHRSVVGLLRAARDLLGFSAADRYLATATIAFDISVAELFLPLLCGGSLLMRDRQLLLAPQRLADEIRRHNVTVAQFGPSVWQLLVDEIRSFPRLRVAISTGEPIAPALAARLPGLCDAAWNLYGPTETTVWATAQRLVAGDAASLSPISAPIGRALAGLDTLVVDPLGQPLADGLEGELWIGGAGVARGYRNQPQLSAERFVMRGVEQRRYYRSGDLVVRTADGTLHYYGRNDDQMKIRGVRIEPREVEAALLALSEIAQAAATWYATPGGAKAVVAAVVWRAGCQLTVEQVLARSAAHLPAALRPSRFLFVASLPLTVSGKVDRQAIRSMATPDPAPARSSSRSMTMTDTEARLMMIWKRLLGVADIGIDEPFFSIGGDSLAAMQMTIEVEKLFDVSLGAQEVFEAPTLRRLASRVDRLRAQPDDAGNLQFVFPLVVGGAAAPLFFSNVDLKLARDGLWRVACPLYAVTQWARGKGFIQARSLAEMAAAQLREIRAIQPAGPYRLGGYSLGGLVALELAQQLQRAGDAVELLFLVDPMLPRRARFSASASIDTSAAFVATPLAKRGAAVWRRLRSEPQAVPALAWQRMQHALQRSRLWQWSAYLLVHCHGRWPNALTRASMPRSRWPAFWYRAQTLARDYVAERFDGPSLAVFHDRGERCNTWRRLLGGRAEVAFIDATHLGMFHEPALGEWMHALDLALARPAPIETTID